MITRRFFVTVALLLFPSLVAHANQAPPRLAEMPEDRRTRGALFSEAWIAFRQEWDGLFAAKIREEESFAWLDAAPPFLLRDILRSAMDPEVLYQSAMRLAQIRTQQTRRLLSDIQKRYTGKMLGTLLAAAQIVAGDDAVRARALSELKSPVTERRVAAGVTLAAAGVPAGLRYFRGAARLSGEEGRYALWALGRFGQASDEKVLQNLAAQRPEDPAPLAALGELWYRRFFPSTYAGYLAQFRFFSDGYTADGEYETWLAATATAVEGGAKTVGQLRADVLKQRKAPAFGSERELTDRRLSAFIDFLDDMSRRATGPAQPKWPRTVPEAVRRMRLKRDPEISAERIAADRIAACLSLLSSLGPAIDYPRFAEPTPGLRPISPSGERALDGNLATSRHLTPASPLVLEHPPGKIRSLWVLTACDTGNLPAKTFFVDGMDPQGHAWHVETGLSPSEFVFQEIPVNRPSAGRIRIFPKSNDISISCITEIRTDIAPR